MEPGLLARLLQDQVRLILEEELARFRTRRLDECAWPYRLIDARYEKVRKGHKIVSQAVLVAAAVSEQGRREIVGWSVGDSESEDIWAGFLKRGATIVMPSHARACKRPKIPWRADCQRHAPGFNSRSPGRRAATAPFSGPAPPRNGDRHHARPPPGLGRWWARHGAKITSAAAGRRTRPTSPSRVKQARLVAEDGMTEIEATAFFGTGSKKAPAGRSRS